MTDPIDLDRYRQRAPISAGEAACCEVETIRAAWRAASPDARQAFYYELSMGWLEHGPAMFDMKDL